MSASTAKSVSGEQNTTPWRTALVEDPAVVLVDERVELLVRDEQQHEVDGLASGVDVRALAELLHACLDVAQEARPCGDLRSRSERRLAVAQVVVERELDVHVQQRARSAAGT